MADNCPYEVCKAVEPTPISCTDAPRCQPCEQPCQSYEPPCQPCQPCEPCPQPCQSSPQQCQPCPQPSSLPCNPSCNPCPVVTDYTNYVQPARQKPIRPQSMMERPCGPCVSDTIYKNSYFCIDPCTAAQCRLPIARPKSNLIPSGDRDNTTVTSLSYPGHFCIPRETSMYPNPCSLLGNGPMQSLTTQKHDFVPKSCCRPGLEKRPDNMLPSGCPLDGNTTQKLSYQFPCGFIPVKSCRPIAPCNPRICNLDTNTTQKLSYQPICPPPKVIYPWAKKPIFCVPNIPMDVNTTHKLSFLPNCCISRRKPIVNRPASDIINSSNERTFDTIYKRSYYGPRCIEKAKPCLPISQILPARDHLDLNTTNTLSYLPNCCVERRQPLIPDSLPLFAGGPIQDLTTQKHDYVCKPYSKPKLIPPIPNITISSACHEKNTTNKLSFMCPGCVCPTKICKPVPNICRSNAPMESNTTQKLSYQPVCPPQKQCLPWAQKPKFRFPNIPVETCTTNRLSYQPPGTFGGCGGCCAPIDCC